MTTEKPTPKAFDPSVHLIKLGTKDYLPVQWRLLWLRTEHPDAVIVTERVGFDSVFACFRATVSIPSGGSATGWGMEMQEDFGDYMEKAETKALGRALAALGYGTQFCEEFESGGSVVDSPVARPSPAPPVAQRPVAAPAHPAGPPAPMQGPRRASASSAPQGGVPDPQNMGDVMKLAHDRKGMSSKDVLNFFMAKRTEEIRITPAEAWAKINRERPDVAGVSLFPKG